jgi:hypothetical protein
MLSVDVTKQNPYQFKQHFREWLDKYIRDLFNINDVLVFVTYQPPKPEWSSAKVIEHTQELFGGVKHVTVIEQTFEKSNMYNYADYIDGYHSHLIMTESDYDSIKHQLVGHDIVAKAVYNLEGLKYYLTKQAGDTYNRGLPLQNIPVITSQGPQEQLELKVVTLKKVDIPKIIGLCIYTLTIPIQYLALLKLRKWNRYIDDT